MKNLSEINLKNRVFGLDLLRALAIMLVFMGHGAFIYYKAYPAIYRFNLIDGVDIFFVLSGFLIGSILIRLVNEKDFSFHYLINFLLRRWIRTIPNYLWILFLITLFSFMFGVPFERSDITLKHLFFMQNLFYPPPRFFPEAWSLSVEEWFYICFPVIAFFAVKVDKQKGLLLSILTLILFPLIYKYYKSFQFEVTGYNYEVYFRKIVLARIDSIAIGVLASYIKYYYNFIFTKYKYVFLAIGIASIVLVSNDFYSGNSYLIFFSFSFSLSLFFVIPWFDSLIKYPKYFGKIVLYFSVTSYSLYLIHLSLILITIQSFINLNSKTETAIGYLIYIIVCPVLALFNYNYFERPILNWRNRKVKE